MRRFARLSPTCHKEYTFCGETEAKRECAYEDRASVTPLQTADEEIQLHQKKNREDDDRDESPSVDEYEGHSFRKAGLANQLGETKGQAKENR